MSAETIRIGLGQLLIEGGEPARNLARAVELIEEAADKECQIVILPETIDLGWTHPSAQNEAIEIPGKYSDILCEAGKANGIYVCAGLTEKDGDAIYNAAVLINDSGDIILKYRKINVLNIASKYYAIGDSLSVVDTPFGKIGVNICSDNYGDCVEIGHVLCRMGAQLILSPSAWTTDYHFTEEDDPYAEKWFGPYNHLAQLFDVAVVGCTSVGYLVGGPYEGKKMVGCSLVVTKEGIQKSGCFNEFASELNTIDLKIPTPISKGTDIGLMLQEKGYYK